MKKIKYLIIAVAALISGTAMAQKITCADVTIEKGGKANLVFSIESDQPSTLAEFFLTMPEGITIEKNSRGRYMSTMGDLPTEDHTATVQDKTNGDVYVLLKNEYGDNFTANSGTLITLPIVAAETAEGTKVIKVTGANITNLAAKQINDKSTAAFDITVTVGTTAISEVNGTEGALQNGKYAMGNQIVIVKDGKKYTTVGTSK